MNLRAKVTRLTGMIGKLTPIFLEQDPVKASSRGQAFAWAKMLRYRRMGASVAGKASTAMLLLRRRILGSASVKGASSPAMKLVRRRLSNAIATTGKSAPALKLNRGRVLKPSMVGVSAPAMKLNRGRVLKPSGQGVSAPNLTQPLIVLHGRLEGDGTLRLLGDGTVRRTVATTA